MSPRSLLGGKMPPFRTGRVFGGPDSSAAGAALPTPTGANPVGKERSNAKRPYRTTPAAFNI